VIHKSRSRRVLVACGSATTSLWFPSGDARGHRTPSSWARLHPQLRGFSVADGLRHRPRMRGLHRHAPGIFGPVQRHSAEGIGIGITRIRCHSRCIKCAQGKNDRLVCSAYSSQGGLSNSSAGTAGSALDRSAGCSGREGGME